MKGTETEDDLRTPARAFFHLAETYWQAALALERADVKSTHPGSPISFLYYHAIELYLKAFLRLHGHSAKELGSRKFGHNTCCLAERAKELGLAFDEEVAIVFSMMATTDAVIRSRYIQVGFHRWPAAESLDRTCKSLRASIGDTFIKSGVHVRL
jgi:hypothetical protein